MALFWHQKSDNHIIRNEIYKWIFFLATYIKKSNKNFSKPDPTIYKKNNAVDSVEFSAGTKISLTSKN